VMIVITHRHCHVEFQGPVYLGPGFALNIPDRGTLIVGPGVDFRRGFYCEIAGDGRVVIGAGTVFTGETMIQCSTSVTIGERSAFGQSTLIVDGNHRFRDHTRHFLDQGEDFQTIDIGEGVMVLTKCTIINNVGDRAVIGAHTVVTKPVPPYCMAVGVPARVVEYFGPPEMRPAGMEDKQRRS
jgi:acetyltransferase-like isoleucine patch superfamily enzyme